MMLGYVPTHAVMFSVAEETLAPVVLVYPVIQMLIIPPTATVKATKRIVAIIGLIAFEFIIII